MANPFPMDQGVVACRFGFNEELRRLYIAHTAELPKPRLVGGLVIKNEEGLIGRALESLSKTCDAVVVLDNGSTDSTVDICKSFPVVQRIEVHSEEFHEGKFRCRVLELAREIGADWILGVDADEVLEDELADELPALLRPIDSATDGYAFYLLHFWRGEESYRVDGKFEPFVRPRLFRNRPHFVADTREMHAAMNPANLDWKRVKIPSVRILHYGYSDYETTLRKQHRYAEHDKQWDFTWLTDESNLETIVYMPGDIPVSSPPDTPSFRFLRESFLAGRWLRHCDRGEGRSAVEAFCDGCKVPSITRALRAGYMLGVV